MTRRQFAGGALASAPVEKSVVSVALRVADGVVMRAERKDLVSSVRAAPGSTVKPLVLGLMKDRRPAVCRATLMIGGRDLRCTHAPLTGPVDAATALAASCNSWFAEHATQLDPAVLEQALLRAGAEARRAESREELILQALGLEGVRFTPLALARMYRKLARDADSDVKRGLELAAKQGTGQLARVEGLQTAGKTGTTREGAWFTGYAPAEKPEIVVVTYLASGLGGMDAAPAAREVFGWWQRHGRSR